MKDINTENLNFSRGDNEARILVITDAPSDKVYNASQVMSRGAMERWQKTISSHDLSVEDFDYVTPCPPIPELALVSDGKTRKYYTEFRAELMKVVRAKNYDAIITMGKVASSQYKGRVCKINSERGTWVENEGIDIMPMFSASHALKMPEVSDIFDSDFAQVSDYINNNYQVESKSDGSNYKWVEDLSDLIEKPPKAISFDLETLGLDSRSDSFRVLTASITTKEGEALVIPLDLEYYNDSELNGGRDYNLSQRDFSRLKAQLLQLLADPSIHFTGHNLKFDIHALKAIGMDIVNWYCDSMQLAFCVDENMKSKSLDDCVRRWIPAMSGYADEFNKDPIHCGKSRMDLVPHDKMLEYAGGDTDATFRLTKKLIGLARKDKRNWNTFKRIQMPTLRAFVNLESEGIQMDTDELRNLAIGLGDSLHDVEQRILSKLPPKLLRKHADDLNLNRADIIRDAIFGDVSEGGLGLTPKVFTKTTEKSDNPLPSTSAKDHLTYFIEHDLVRDFINRVETSKLISTYVGQEEGEEVKDITRLKAGGVPKRVKDILDANGVAVTSFTGVNDVEVRDSSVNINLPEGSLLVDKFDNIRKVSLIEAKGFWQHLSKDNYIHTNLSLHKTNTGRTASASPNLQNVPKRGDFAIMFRKCFYSNNPTDLFIESDLSQAEIRFVAWMANERAMKEIYLNGGDIHCSTASSTVGAPLEVFMAGLKDNTPLIDVSSSWEGADAHLLSLAREFRGGVKVKDFCKLKRTQAKAINFGFLYGMGWKGFKVYAKTTYKIDYTDAEAERAREVFFQTYPDLLVWHRSMKKFAGSNGYVRSPHGALRRLPNVRSNDSSVVAMAERQAVNAPIQRIASDTGIIALSRFMRDCPPELAKIVLFIHDANFAKCHVDDLDEVAGALRWYMETTPWESWFGITPPIPITADISYGTNLGNMVEAGDDVPDIPSCKPEWYNAGLSNYESIYTEGEVATLINAGVLNLD